MSGNNLRRSRRSIDTYCASYEFFSRGPKTLLKTQNFENKKAIFPVKETLWPVFFRIFEHDECQGTS